MSAIRPVLYTKIGCPWCEEARVVLNREKIDYEEKVVTGHPENFAAMEKLSGQTKAPVLDWSGEVLADFGAEELVPFLTRVK